MSCNGCRVLRKGCSENCMLRQSLQCIDNPQAQAHATIFVAKFFGRAGLMSFLSSVADPQRPALFQSLLFESVGRAVNPVSGAVGLLWTGNWNICLSAVQTVLRGGRLQPLPEFSGGVSGSSDLEDVAETVGVGGGSGGSQSRVDDFVKMKGFEDVVKVKATDFDLCLMIGNDIAVKRMREPTSSEESETTTLGSSSNDRGVGNDGEKKLLRLFI
ncbi:hypothetical protein HRI_001128800 [Hibiscus trionum]|uniref:LOB domain-containing protein n=1 Tax=Hibiscus trionum TaxID=183268 RepID=A0A9W7HBN2_HIBTR|nr:hypothetical protein HRI_001128800 [Hibiscus trionum]